MKQAKIFLILFIILSVISLSYASNPFTTKTKNKQTESSSFFKSKFFVKIIIYQHFLKEKISSLARQAKETKSIRPFIFLIMIAFAYGVIHAVGPGHGKAISLSYGFAQNPTYTHSILFGASMALFHGISGILFVLIVRMVLNASISHNLENITHITQIVSYSIIICFGLGIVIYNINKLIKSKNKSQNNKPKKQYVNPVLSAVVVGSIPCPAVVMVMLFAISIDLIFLGIILGLAISIGMALTISVIIIIAISGKNASFFVIRKKNRLAVLVEKWVEIFAGIVLMILGILFLGAVL